MLQVRGRVPRAGGSSLVTDAQGNPVSFSRACNSNPISFCPCGGAGLWPCCKGRHRVPTHSTPLGREDLSSQQRGGKQEALEVLGILQKCQDFSRNPTVQTSALANRLPTSAWSTGWSPRGEFGLGSGMRPLAHATAGGLLGHVLVGGGLQEPGVGVLLHQSAGLGLGFVEASGGGTREVLTGDLPGFMVNIHLQGSSVHKH